MKKTKILLVVVLALVLCLTLSLTACQCNHDYVDGVCSKCGEKDPNYVCKHTYVDGVCSKCGEKDPNYQPPQPSKAVITVNPETLEVTPDDEVVLMFGVSATLDGKEVEVIIADNGGFDPADMKEGTYTITYKAGTGDAEATATRTIIVSAPLSQLALEVRQNYLGEQKWQGNLLTFKNALYVDLTQDTTLTTQSGVFHNNSENEITLNVDGAYGCAAVLDKNGVVIEGRDGANSKLVNAENPTRTASSATTIIVDGEEVAVNNAFAKQLKIPAGGYAVVIQNKYASEAGADFDGRGFMNYNVIYAVGNVVRLFWVDSGVTEGLLTPYVNQAPYFSGDSTVYAQMGDKEFKLEEAVKAGLVVKDDNNTFEITDDVTLEEITLSDNGGFDINKIGSYTVTMTVTDGTLSTTIARKVEVKDDYITLTVGDKTFRAAPEKYIYNQEVSTSSAAKYSMIVLDKAYTGEFATNGYGCAIVLDQYGTLLRIYDGANLGLYDKDGKAAAAPFTVNTYATYAWEQLGEGETLIVFPNDGKTNEARTFGLSLRPVNGSHNYCGETCTLTGITFEQKQFTFTVGEKSFTADANAYAFNDSSVTAKNITSYRMVVYNKDYTGEVSLNGYGCAIVLDQYGTLLCVYDAANGGFYDKDGKAATISFTTANYATYAWEHLGDGETLIVFPNVGGANEARAFDLSLRTDGSIGKTCTLTDVNFKDPNEKPEPVTTVTIKIGDNTFTKEGEITAALNPNATAATEYDFYIYTTAFSGALGFANGYGEAFVIGADNKIVRIYDGANAKYFDADNPNGIQNAEILTAANYLEKALLSLKQGEYLLVAPNNGGTNLARNFLRDGNRTIGATVEIAIPEVTIKPSEKDASALLANGKYFYNPVIVANAEAAKPADLDFVVYSYGYNGVVIKNGWSEIFVVDVTTGKVVVIYDGVNGKYYDAENASGVARTDEMFTLANMSLEAFEKLLPNQMMVVGLNGGRNDKAGRTFLVGSRTLDKDMAIVGASIAAPATEAVAYAKITVGTKIWYQDASKIAVDNAYTGTPAFAIYHHGYTGELVKGGYGVAFVVDQASGKVVKIFDGASVKYFDAENPNGATNAGCTAAGYITEAFASLQEGQYLLIAPNGGSAGNVARGLLYGSRKIDTIVSYTLPQSDAQ